MGVKEIFKSKLVGNTVIYSITNALYTGLPLLLLPFLVGVLSPEDYGIVELFRSLTLVLVPILGLSAVQSIGRLYFDLSEKEFKVLVSSIQIFQFFATLVALLIILILSTVLNREDTILLLLSVIYFFFNQVTESLLVIFRVKENAIKYLWLRIANIGLELGLMTILFFLLHSHNWMLRVVPIVFASSCIGIISFFVFKQQEYKIHFSKKLLIQGLTYSSPLILHMLSGYILNIGDRFLIKAYLTPEDLGNYSVAYQAGMAINFFYTSFNLAWTPTFFKWMKEGKFILIEKVRKLVYFSLSILGALAGLAWYFLFPYIDTGNKYNISFNIVIVILLSYIILSFYKFETNYFLYNKATKRLSIYTMISALVSVILNLILIPKIGIMGAAISTLVSFSCVYVFILLNKNNVKKN